MLQVVHRFRQGGFNTLVSTCVGEEGLDIGEVDLIVCFDAQKNPIRLVQRMGRTGRKRQGRIVVIVAEGREERVSVEPWTLKSKVWRSTKCTLRSSSQDQSWLTPHRSTKPPIPNFYPLCSSDVQPEPEQQAQCVQVHYRQQKRFPLVPQQSPHAAPGCEPHPT